MLFFGDCRLMILDEKSIIEGIIDAKCKNSTSSTFLIAFGTEPGRIQMTENEIRNTFRELFNTNDETIKLKKLSELHLHAKELHLESWQNLITARIALIEEHNDKVIDLMTQELSSSQIDPEMKNWARYIRGFAFGQKKEFDQAIPDYTAVIDDPCALAEQKINAYSNRGAAYGQINENDIAIADFTSVIEDPTSPADQKAWARLNRGVAYGQKKEPDLAIADFTSVIEDPTSPDERKARGRLVRGIAYGQKKEPDLELADYKAVIDDSTASSFLREQAAVLLSASQSNSPSGSPEILQKLPIDIDPATRERFSVALAKGRTRKDYFFSNESNFDSNASFLLVLREWNSYTPAIPDVGEPAKGGGYFLKHRGHGIIIDPGFDFLENFWEAGGKLCDIDSIVITHAHNDHTADLEAILTLMYEYNDKNPEQKRQASLYLSQGAARKFSGLLALKSCTYIKEIITLNRGNREHPQEVYLSNDIKLTILTAYHDDIITSTYSVGLAFEFLFNDYCKRVVFTGDTAFLKKDNGVFLAPIHEAYPSAYGKPDTIDILIAHIGSIETSDLDGPLAMKKDGKLCESDPETFYDKHLALRGTFILLTALRPKVAIISEFGEEMRSIWIEAVKLLDQKLNQNLPPSPNNIPIRVLPGDPVLICKLCDCTFLCHEDFKFYAAADLITVESHQADMSSKLGPVRPYLFKDKTIMLTQSVARIEDCIKQFHTALVKRELPHFSPAAKPMRP